ncbi:MAG TPA: hypothetical protein VHM31_00520 [Polyangia bacterium]|nr:hypothetical protein [Polyangia bacterium]
MTRASEEAPPPTLSALAHEVGLSFPASARLIWAGRESGIDDMVSFKVEIAPADLPAFLSSSPVPADAFAPGEGGLLGSDLGPWNPSQAVRLRTGQIVRPNHSALNIGIDDGKPNVVVLYVVSHST